MKTLRSLIAVAIIAICEVPQIRAENSKLIGEPRTPTITLVSSSGTVATGSKNVEFIFSSDFVGTVLGVAYTGAIDAVQSFTAPPGDTLKAIAYTRSAGSIRIAVIR